MSLHTCPKGHASHFRPCPQCAAESRPIRTASQRAQAVMDKMAKAREGRKEKKRRAVASLANKRRWAMYAWERGGFLVGLA